MFIIIIYIQPLLKISYNREKRCFPELRNKTLHFYGDSVALEVLYEESKRRGFN